MSADKHPVKESKTSWYSRQSKKLEKVNAPDTPSPLTKGQIIRANVMQKLKEAHPTWGLNQLNKATEIEVTRRLKEWVNDCAERLITGPATEHDLATNLSNILYAPDQSTHTSNRLDAIKLSSISKPEHLSALLFNPVSAFDKSDLTFDIIKILNQNEEDHICSSACLLVLLHIKFALAHQVLALTIPNELLVTNGIWAEKSIFDALGTFNQTTEINVDIKSKFLITRLHKQLLSIFHQIDVVSDGLKGHQCVALSYEHSVLLLKQSSNAERCALLPKVLITGHGLFFHEPFKVKCPFNTDQIEHSQETILAPSSDLKFLAEDPRGIDTLVILAELSLNSQIDIGDRAFRNKVANSKPLTEFLNLLRLLMPSF